MRLKNYTLLTFLLLTISFLPAQDFMLQGWYWDYDKDGCNNYNGDSWAQRLNSQVAALDNAGFTYVWLPPLSRSSFGSCSNGYDPKDLYDLGEYGLGSTGFGTRSQVDAVIANLNGRGMNAVADVVYNHRDGGQVEDNPAVKAYIETHMSGGKNPFPSDRFRCRLPIGGAYGAGVYYFKISSKTQSFGANTYKFYATVASQNKPFQGQINESEPNGGGDCGQANDIVLLDQDIIGTLYDFSGCYTDEFQLTIQPADYNNSGDDLLIFLNNTFEDDTGYSDHRIYAIYYDPDGDGPLNGFDINLNDLRYETYTNFNGLPSNQGGMTFENFKPNSSNAATTFLNGEWDSMLFFYDVDQDQTNTATVYNDWTWWLHNSVGINGLRMDAVKHFPPAFVGQLLDNMAARGFTPGMVVGEFFDNDAGALANWVSQVNANVSNSQALVRVFDFSLREALKNACDNGDYDVRDLFNSSIRDATTLDGFSVVTFVNNHDYRKPGEPVQNDPLLAYAYILTNNQIGLPTVFYPDFFGTSIPNAPVLNGQTKLAELIDIHRNHIFGATEVVYLNRYLSSQFGDYQQGSPDQAAIYQLKGGTGSEAVIVAINFGNSTLKVDQEIDLSTNVNPGAEFTDLTNNAYQPIRTVSAQNRLLIDVPARSYAVYTLSETALPTRLSCFDATLERNDFVRLHWCSALEVQQAFYELEVSDNDGSDFKILSRHTANNQASEYTYLDRRPWNETSKRLYRLRMVDFDGTTTYSRIEAIQLNRHPAKISVYPNPAGQQVFVRNLPVTGNWQLLDVTGRSVSIPSTRLDEVVRFDTSTLPKGIYTLRAGDQVARIVIR